MDGLAKILGRIRKRYYKHDNPLCGVSLSSLGEYEQIHDSRIQIYPFREQS